MLRIAPLLPILFLSASSGCASPERGRALEVAPSATGGAAVAAPAQQPFPSERRPLHRWSPGQPLMHGFVGLTFAQDVEVEGDGGGRIDGDKGELDELPLLGGGAQWKLGGESVSFGLEGLLSVAWRSDAEAFVVGGGGAAVAIDVDLFVLELFGGPFASAFLGETVRVYGGAGPLLQWADYDQSENGLADDGSGFGSGLYARTGIEFALPSRVLVGFGVRWSDTRVDLGGSLGDLEMDGLQAVVTVSRGI